MRSTTVSERALVLAPRGRDSAIAVGILREAQLEATACESVPSLIAALNDGAAFIVATEESLLFADLEPIDQWLKAQEEWSDLPFILLTSRGGLERNPAAVRFLKLLGNVTFLERPFHPTTLVSVATAAVRARLRQYQARARLLSLRESESRARALINASSDVVYRMSPDWLEMRQLDGRGFLTDSDQPSVKWIDAYIFPEDRNEVMETITDAVKKKDVFELEHRVRRADGTLGWTFSRAIPLLDTKGDIVEWFGMASDITARKAADTFRAALVSFTDRIRNLDDADQLAYVAASVLGETLRVSRASYGIVDSDAATLTVERDWHAPGVASLTGTLKLRDYGSIVDDLKLGHFIVVSNVDTDPRTASAAEALKHRNAGSFVNVPVMERGKLVAVLFLNNAGPRRWNKAELAFVQDIADRTRSATERLRAEKALRVSNETLEARIASRTEELVGAAEALRQSQKMEAVGQLTGGVAHDFNNLLMVVSAGLSLLKRSPKAERRETILGGMEQAVQRGARLTRQLLAFSRRQPLVPVSLALDTQIDAMRDLLDRSLGGDITVATRFPTTLWPVFVDESELELSLLNLCVNSRDAMPNGGTITISAKNVSDVVAGDYVRLSVTDTGAGMDAATSARVFEPYFTTKEIGKGSGLGLAQVYAFAEKSGGKVEIVSAPGEGTTVSVSLPRSKEAPAFDAASAEVQNPAAASGQLLLVEDDDTLAALTGDMIEEIGYAVTRVSSAAAALTALAEDSKFDLVFSDIMMPGNINGVDLATAIRRRHPKLPVILASGYATRFEKEAAAEGIALLSKPYELQTLAEMLARLVAEAK